MLDNLTLPPPPTATGTPVYYRYSFYNIPFSRDGEDIPLPEAVEEKLVATELRTKNYLQYEVITNRAFRSEQESVIIPQTIQLNAIAYNFNYCRVAAVRDVEQELYDYTYDLNANYYWIDNTEFLSIMDGFINGAIQFNISKDYIMSNMIIDRLTETDFKARLRGIIDITNARYEDENETTGLGVANLKGSSINNYKILDAYIQYALVVCYATDKATLCVDVVDCSIDNPSNPDDTYNNLMNCVDLVSNAYKVVIGSAELGNVTVKKMYALPLEWVKDYIQTTNVGTKELVCRNVSVTQPTPHDVRVKTQQFSKDLYNAKTPVYSFTGVPLTPPKNVWEKWFLKFPSRLIELTGNPLNANFFDFSIYIDIPSCGYVYPYIKNGSDSVVIRLLVNGDFLDISDVFSVDFAVNEDALRQNQFKELTVLEGLSAVVGGAAGIAGGITSGNYFGAVQAGVGGVEKLGNLLTAGKKPAQLRANGSFFNGLKQYGVIALIGLTEAENAAQLDNLKTRYGWKVGNVISTSFIVDRAENMNGKYFKFNSLYVERLPRKGAYAESVITSKFSQGARFKLL